MADTVCLFDARGGLRVGSPEELVGGGYIGEAFDTGDVTFSPERGRFELRV